MSAAVAMVAETADSKPAVNPEWAAREDERLRIEVLHALAPFAGHVSDPLRAAENTFRWVKTGEIQVDE